jgi:hypothetical protein
MIVELSDEEINVLVRCIATQEWVTPQNEPYLKTLAEKLICSLKEIKMAMPASWKGKWHASQFMEKH